MERLVNKYERGQIQHVDWLDRLAFSAMEKAKDKECEKKTNFYPSLVVELCSFEHRVVFQVSITHYRLLQVNEKNTHSISSVHISVVSLLHG
jgi:hypothetical protein